MQMSERSRELKDVKELKEDLIKTETRKLRPQKQRPRKLRPRKLRPQNNKLFLVLLKTLENSC